MNQMTDEKNQKKKGNISDNHTRKTLGAKGNESREKKRKRSTLLLTASLLNGEQAKNWGLIIKKLRTIQFKADRKKEVHSWNKKNSGETTRLPTNEKRR